MTIPVAALGEDADRIHAWLARTTLSASEPPTLRLSVGEALGRTLAPIAVKDDILGFLSIVGRRGTLSDVDDLAASRGAAACAIELSRERAVLEAEDRLHADVVEALLTGSYQSPEAIITRARRLGFDLHGEYTAVVLAADAASSGTPDLHRRARAELERAIERRGLAAMTGARSDRLVILIPRDAAGSTAPQALAAELCEALREVFDTSFSAGVGLPHAGVDGIRQAYREADGALGIGLAVFGAGRVCHYADLGLYRVLLAIRDTPELEAFRRETLGALLDYDGRNDGELIKTLEAYFAALGSPTDAAARLHVHRNTLLYRLKRIQEIAGVDLDDAEARLALHLALRAGDVSGAAGPPGRTAQISRPPFRTGRT